MTVVVAKSLDQFLASGDLVDLVIGSEGTLAFFSRLRLRLAPLPATRVLGVCQTFEPAGLFARDLAECLSLQLATRDRLDPARRERYRPFAFLHEEMDDALAAAELALFANEGDNAIGGVRKKLLEGGHHFNAAGEEAGVYEDGYVIVTREAKAAILDPALTVTQPALVTACTGMDAIAHAVESHVSTRRNPLSRLFSLEAWRLLGTRFSTLPE